MRCRTSRRGAQPRQRAGGGRAGGRVGAFEDDALEMPALAVARERPEALSTAQLVALQRQAGNEAVAALLRVARRPPLAVSRQTAGTPSTGNAGPATATGPCRDEEPRPHPLIVRGSVHPAVREAQRKLNRFLASVGGATLLVEDCIFGAKTYAAVVAFQRSEFKAAREWDGKVGPKTWERLDAVAAGTTPPRPVPVPPVPGGGGGGGGTTPTPVTPGTSCGTPPPCPVSPTSVTSTPTWPPRLKRPVAGGSGCRGACGPDCPGTCTSLGTMTRTITTTNGCTWQCTYPNVLSCGSHLGCRQHDACYDRCLGRGESNLCNQWPVGTCHCGCDYDCITEHGMSCNRWRVGNGPFDVHLLFSDPPPPATLVPAP